MQINMLHLYHDLLNLYGEYGNVIIMKKHLEDQGFEVKLDKKTVGDEIKFSDYDFIYMGCGTERNLDIALEDLKRYASDINLAIENKKVFLCTGNSFEMFGKNIDKKGLPHTCVSTLRPNEVLHFLSFILGSSLIPSFP